MANNSEAKAILANIHALRQRRYVGDLGASDALLDFETAVRNAKLTERQKEALALVYGEDLTQEKAGKRMGTTRDVVSRTVSRAERKIDITYDKWSKLETEDGLL